jgi:hypothetical protein
MATLEVNGEKVKFPKGTTREEMDKFLTAELERVKRIHAYKESYQPVDPMEPVKTELKAIKKHSQRAAKVDLTAPLETVTAEIKTAVAEVGEAIVAAMPTVQPPADFSPVLKAVEGIKMPENKRILPSEFEFEKDADGKLTARTTKWVDSAEVIT